MSSSDRHKPMSQACQSRTRHMRGLSFTPHRALVEARHANGMSHFAKIAVAVVAVCGLAGFFGVRMMSETEGVSVGSAVNLSAEPSAAGDDPANTNTDADTEGV